jgi:hypothetical protein
VGLPDIDAGICIALPAEDLRIGVATSAVPDIEDPAFFAEHLSATVADNNGLVFTAYLANPAFGCSNHESFVFPKYF